jgi:hypothetical protein
MGRDADSPRRPRLVAVEGALSTRSAGISIAAAAAGVVVAVVATNAVAVIAWPLDHGYPIVLPTTPSPSPTPEQDSKVPSTEHSSGGGLRFVENDVRWASRWNFKPRCSPTL